MNSVLMILFVLGFNSIRSNAATLSTEDKCIPLEDCPQVVDLIDTKGTHFGTKNLLRMLHCRNRDRQAYIKCVSQSKITEYLEKAELLPSPEGCGLVDLHEKISGGEATDLDEYPWIALLKYRNQAGKINYGCHANLISKKYVVTAAHCVDRSSPSIKEELIGNVYSVILGEYDIRNVTDCIYHAYGDDCADEVKEFLVQSYKVHPEYVASSKVNDIALVRLQGEVEFSDFIKPVCLPPNALRLNHSETWWVGGWGETADYKMNEVKQKAKFSYKKKDECVVNIKVSETQICAGSSANAKTCPGDSGGPLMMHRKIGENFRMFLIGITSLGADCNKDVQITIFTKTSAYVDWIIETLEK